MLTNKPEAPDMSGAEGHRPQSPPLARLSQVAPKASHASGSNRQLGVQTEWKRERQHAKLGHSLASESAYR